MRTGIGALLLVLSVLSFSCRSRPPYAGKDAAALEQMLHDPSANVQAQGAYGLSQLGPEASSAVPSLIEALKGEPLVRQNAALALGKIGPEARAAVPALEQALADPEWTVRRQAALALKEIGPDARRALPVLAKLKDDPSKLVRQAALEASTALQSTLGPQ